MNASSNGSGSELCSVNVQTVPFAVAYALVFLVSAVGNLGSLHTLIHQPDTKRRLGVYLRNLMVADLLLTAALPFKVVYDLDLGSWGLLVFHCQASAVALYIGLYAAILFLAFAIIDCCLQEAQSLWFLQLQGVGFARLVSAVVWVLLLLLMVPNMAIPTRPGVQARPLHCVALKSEAGLRWHALSVFLSSALFLNASGALLLCGGLALRRLLRAPGGQQGGGLALRRLLRAPGGRRGGGLAVCRLLRAPGARRGAVALAAACYTACFVPYHGVRTPYTLTQTSSIQGCSARRSLFLAKEWSLLLAVGHACVGPLLHRRLMAHGPAAMETPLGLTREGGEGDMETDR